MAAKHGALASVALGVLAANCPWLVLQSQVAGSRAAWAWTFARCTWDGDSPSVTCDGDSRGYLDHGESCSAVCTAEGMVISEPTTITCPSSNCVSVNYPETNEDCFKQDSGWQKVDNIDDTKTWLLEPGITCTPAATAPPAPTPKLFTDIAPNLHVNTVLDEQYAGYCIDLQGHDADNLKCDLVRAHTCKVGGNETYLDTQFEYRPEDGTIRSVFVDENCDAFTGGGGCLTALAREDESALVVGPCTLGPEQVFTQYATGMVNPDSSWFTLDAADGTKLCLAVGTRARSAGGNYMMRDLELLVCSEIPPEQKEWRAIDASGNVILPGTAPPPITVGTVENGISIRLDEEPTGLHYDSTTSLLHVLCITGTHADAYLFAYTTSGNEVCRITIPAAAGMTRPEGFSIVGTKAYIADSTGPSVEDMPGRLRGSVYELDWTTHPCGCGNTGTCASNGVTWSPTVLRSWALWGVEGGIDDGSGMDDVFRNSGIAVSGDFFYGVNAVHQIDGSYTNSYPKSIVKVDMSTAQEKEDGYAPVVMKWSFDASTLGRDIDMEGLACGADDCSSALYAGDEYNYVYKLDFASGTVTHEWDLRDIVGTTPTDRGIEGLAFDGTWWYAGIQGTNTIHQVKLSESTAQAQLPNFLIFQPDDLEWVEQWAEEPQRPPSSGDSPDYPTTNLDKLRSEGVVFTRAYASATMCAPSRFSVLTGRYASRSEYSQAQATDCDTTITDVTVPNSLLDGDFDTSNNLVTALKLVDPTYRAGTFGKWHVSDYVDGTDQETTSYAAQQAKALSKGFDVAGAFYIGNMDGNSFASTYGYTHNLEYMVAEATDFFAESVQAEEPFFAYVNPTAPHAPDISEALMPMYRRNTPAGMLSTDPDGGSMETRDRVSALTTQYGEDALGTIWVDDAFGALYDSLEALGVLDETVVVFEMDHGAGVTNGLFEHGARIAMFARYPPLFQPGLEVGALIQNIDVLPTFVDIAAEAAGTPIPEITVDGQSFKALASGQGCAEDRTLFIEYTKHRAAVTATHKLIRLSDCDEHRSPYFPDAQEQEQLYDLVPMYCPNGGTADAEQESIVNDVNFASVLATMNAALDAHMTSTQMGARRMPPKNKPVEPTPAPTGPNACSPTPAQCPTGSTPAPTKKPKGKR